MTVMMKMAIRNVAIAKSANVPMTNGANKIRKPDRPLANVSVIPFAKLFARNPF
jgi:hypothetical protein